MTQPDIKISVSATSLRAVLSALVGHSHEVAELQVTRTLDGNPINALVEQYNAEIKRTHDAAKKPEFREPSEIDSAVRLIRHAKESAMRTRLTSNYGSTPESRTLSDIEFECETFLMNWGHRKDTR